MKVSDQPLVSVVIPAYNAQAFVEKAVNSVLAQDYPKLEVLVVNDGSQDDTPRLLSRYGDRITVIHQENAGLSAARNRGISAAKGEFICLLDADDYWLSGKISAQVALMLAHPEVGFCSATTRLVDEHGKTIGHWRYPDAGTSSTLERLFEAPGCIAGSGSAVMVRKHLLQSAGLFDRQLRCLEDVDMWMRLAALSEYACLEHELCVVFKRSGSMSSNRHVMRQSMLDVFYKNRNLLPKTRQRHFWRSQVGRNLTDYAKWAYRANDKVSAFRDLFKAWCYAPLANLRLVSGLASAFILGHRV